MDDTQRERIAAAVNMLRPEWPAASIVTLLGRTELRNRPARDVAVALTWVACDPRSETPARVLLHGIWWRAAGVAGERTHTGLTMAQGCHCGRPLHEPDDDCPDPGRYRQTVADREAGYLKARAALKNAEEGRTGRT